MVDKRWTPYIGEFLTRYNELDLYFWKDECGDYPATVTVNKSGKMTWLEYKEGSHTLDETFDNLLKPHIEALRLAIQKGLCE